MNSTDEELMAEVRSGDLRKLALLFERHHRRLYNFFLHMSGERDVSEDLVQEAFMRILRYRDSYLEGRSFSAWMYQIARNLNVERSQKRRGELRLIPAASEEDRVDTEPASTDPGVEETLVRRQEIGMLRRAVAMLPDEKREVLVLSRFQNMKYEDVAAVLGCEIGAVKVRVYRALRALGQIYSELSGEKAS